MNKKNEAISLLCPPECDPDYKKLSDVTIHDLGLPFICEQITDKKAEQALFLSILFLPRRIGRKPSARHSLLLLKDLPYRPER